MDQRATNLGGSIIIHVLGSSTTSLGARSAEISNRCRAGMSFIVLLLPRTYRARGARAKPVVLDAGCAGMHCIGVPIHHPRPT